MGEQETRRIEWIDNIKGIGIFLVVLGHLNLQELDMKLIYSFHMPLFIFISGYLFNPSPGKSTSTVMRKKARSLLIPYLIYCSVSIVFYAAFNYVRGEGLPNVKESIQNLFYLNGSVGWNSPLWFLIVLFLVDVIFFAAMSYNKQLLIPIIATGLLGGYFFSLSDMTFAFGINIAVMGLFFYGLGFLMKKYSIIETITRSWISFASTSLILAAIWIVLSLYNIRVDIYANVLGNYVYFISAALAGVLLTFLLFRKIKPMKLIRFYGENSLLILSTHFFLILVYQVINEILFSGRFLSENPIYINLLIAFVTFAIYYPVIKLVNKYLPFLVKPRYNKRVFSVHESKISD